MMDEALLRFECNACDTRAEGTLPALMQAGWKRYWETGKLPTQWCPHCPIADWAAQRMKELIDESDQLRRLV